MQKILCCLLLLGLLIQDTHAQLKEKLIISSGAFGILDDEKVFMGSAELLFEEKDRMINPKFGLMITSENSICSYIGFCLKQQLIYNLSLSFTFAPGLYYSFKEDKLGHILEFNSGIEVTYAVTSQNEISLSFHHISNGGLAKFNPGAEFILISYTIPLRR